MNMDCAGAGRERDTFSQEYPSLLAREGRLEAIKRGRNWHTTRKAVRAYIRSIKKGKLGIINYQRMLDQRISFRD